jgi:Ca2+-binding RTX toxin-like protein
MTANQVYTLTVRATGTGGAFVDKVISIQTGANNTDDTLTGSGLTDVIYGLDGRDTLNGFGNSDTLFGQAGRDTLNGGVGSDDLTGGTGDDTINGGAGADTIRYAIGDGIDTVDGGTGIVDRLIISAAAGDQVLDVLYDGISLTDFGSIGLDLALGTVTGVEQVTANLGGGVDTLDYAGSTAAVTINLGAGTASGFTSIAGIEEISGGAGNDSLTGSAGGNVIWGEGGNDTIIGGADADDLNGGAGADSIDTGAADDNQDDIIQYFAANEFGDTITNFDATGGVGIEDQVVFVDALNTAYDDGRADDNFLFVTGTAGGATTNATVGQGNGDAEALLLNNGVTAANLTNLAAVSAAINTEFNFINGGVANGEDAVLVVDASGNAAAGGNNFGVYQWIQAGGGETTANELTLIGVFTANGTVVAANFDFF